MNYPVIELVLRDELENDPEHGMQGFALVDRPAIEKNFVAFNADRVMFAANDEKRIVSGPALIPDMLIPRNGEQGNYYATISRDTISKLAVKFFKDSYHKNVNAMHDQNAKFDGVTFFESFISDQSRGIQPMKGFEDLPDGTWFLSAKVDNDEAWQGVKNGRFKGFSIEAMLAGRELKMSKPSHIIAKIMDILNQVDAA